MALNLASMRDGLKTRLATISGLRSYDIVPDNPATPFAAVIPVDASYLEAMAGGAATVDFEVAVVVSKTIDRASQDALDAYLSAGTGQTSSVIDAIHGDRTLGGAVADAVVVGFKDYGAVEVNGNQYLGARIIVRTIVPRS